MTVTLNKVQLIGHLGDIPKVLNSKEDKPFATVNIATDESFKKDDAWQTKTQWHKLVLFGSILKIAEYLQKGSLVYVEGKISNNNWTDNDGNKRYSYSIIVTRMQIISSPNKEASDKTPEKHIAEMREALESDADVPF